MRWAALKKIAVFGAVGMGASLLHIALVWALLPVALAGGGALGVYAANTAGFCAAFIWSYIGHYYLTFQSTKGHRGAILPFATVAVMGFLINTLILALWQSWVGDASIWAVVVAVALSAGAVFVASNFWAFAKR
jgi:putative flippase GtrA